MTNHNIESSSLTPPPPTAENREEPCRVLVLSDRRATGKRIAGVFGGFACRIKTVKRPFEALASIHDYDPHLFVVDTCPQDLSLEEICDAIRIPRQVKPLALLLTAEAASHADLDRDWLGIDDVIKIDSEDNQLAVMLHQHFRLMQLERKVLHREQEILDSLPNALFVTDRSSILWKVNHAFARLYGIEEPDRLRQQLGKPLMQALAAASRADFEQSPAVELTSALFEAVRRGSGEFRFSELIDERERHCTGRLTALVHDRNRFLVDLCDMTDRERGLLRKARQERLATIGNLSLGIAHEIQNPNTFSRVSAGSLKEIFGALRPHLEKLLQQEGDLKIGALPLKTAINHIDESIAGVEKASRRVAEVLDSLRNFGKSDEEKISAINPREAVEEAVLLTKHTCRSITQVQVDLPDNLPAVRARCCELSQVFVNLIENAVQAFALPVQQARGEGSAEIRIQVDEETDADLVLAVTDNGPGIDKAMQERIFRPYYTTREQGEGTGLGLSLSSDILHRFGGDLTVRSRPGRGATFLIALKKTQQKTERREASDEL